MDLSRRNFLKGAAVGALGLAAGGVLLPAAGAEDSAIAWDDTYDVIVAGFGIGGATAAVVSADLGARVLLVEKAPEADAGGGSKYAGQLVLSTEDADEFYKYLVAMTDQYEHVSDYEALRVYADGCAENYDWLIKLGANADVIGTMSMFEYPELPGVDSVKIWLVTGRSNDSGYYRLLKSNVEARDTIDVWYDSPAVHLIQDPKTKTVLGVQIQKDGKILNIASRGGVILATGGFENNPKMITNYLDMPYVYTWAALHNTGDGIRMGMEAGADLWHMSVCAGYFWGFVPDGTDPTTVRCYRPGSVPWGRSPARLGMMVGKDGSRWMNEAQTHRHGRWNVAGEWISMKHPVPVHVIFDEDARLEHLTGLFSMWSQNGEEEIEKGWIIKADTLEELAEKLGMNADNLVRAAQDINDAFDEGRSAQYERPADTLQPIRKAPFYAIKMAPTMYNTDGGPLRNAKAEVLDTNGDPIPHLFSCGELGSIHGHMYNGGGNIAECTIFGRIAARGAVACASELTGTFYGEGNGPKPEASDSLGAQEITGNYKDGVYTAYGEGMIGRFPVTVTIEGGRITAVEVGDHGETPGIGTNAIDALPGAIVEAQTYDVDVIAGATMTSNAIKSAVKACLIEASV
ncbi:MAG: FAD-binding protein [Clostridia bacterium]|nr:FAD-binding protein [Clostridia bacterium]